MRKILIKAIACAMLLGAGLVGASSIHKASAAELTTTSSVTTLSTYDPGGGVKP